MELKMALLAWKGEKRTTKMQKMSQHKNFNYYYFFDGWAGKPNPNFATLRGLGLDPVTVTATSLIAVASPILVALIQSGIFKSGKYCTEVANAYAAKKQPTQEQLTKCASEAGDDVLDSLKKPGETETPGKTQTPGKTNNDNTNQSKMTMNKKLLIGGGIVTAAGLLAAFFWPTKKKDPNEKNTLSWQKKESAIKINQKPKPKNQKNG